MKIAISGKGGVGKTTLSALMAQYYADKGRDVLVVDADPSPCLADALGFPHELREKLTPVAEMEDLIYERTGAKKGSIGGYFIMNPRVDDIPERFSVTHRGVRLLEMGAIETGGSGCICPEGALLRTLVTHLLLRRDEVLILDMYAGVEHLGRATADAVDAMLVVVEPTMRSLGTAAQIKKLANDIGITRVYLVGNKVRDEEEAEFVRGNSPDLPVIGILPATDKVIEADRLGVPVYDHAPELVEAARQIADKVDDLVMARSEGNGQ